ncbi:MAG: hypothetical protein JW882_09920 [Deltaproteobacteria bacterium]|nr:hypothetical protein [Deltaproteobacteria bacterium]
MDEKFLKAVEKVLEHEGGYINDPDDPGGETNFGISKRSYPDMDIKNLTRDQAIQIYRKDWWEKYGYGKIEDPEIAAKVFDLAVNMGPGKAHIHLQFAVMRSSHIIKLDGIMGPETIGAVNRHPDPALLLAELKLRAIRYYADLNQPKYLKGWIYRAID